MRLWSGIKNILYKSDLFDSGSLLRVKGEPEYKTLLGGFLSITMMVILIAAFYSRIIDTLDKILISSTLSTTNANDPLPFNISTLDTGPFMFGVEVWHHNLNEGDRYFDVVLTNTVYYYGEPLNTSIQYKLEPCTREHWNGFPDIQANFQPLYMAYWKCLPKNTNFEIKGKYSSKESNTLNVAIKKCTNTSTDARPCAPQVEIDSYFTANTINYYTIYFINPLINPDKQNYLTYYLEDTNYIIFSQNGGAEGLLYIQDYTIDTDESILPTTNYQTKTGGIIQNFAIKNSYSSINDTYATFIFFKSATSINIIRSFQKLDNVLSYIGGLFGTIIIFFFLVSSYNTYKFEVNLAGYLFRTEKNEQKIEKNYNLLYYIGQGIYSFLRLLNFRPNWETLSRYYEIRQEMLKQLDVLYLIKRINFLQKSLTFLFSEHQLKGIHLACQLTMADAIKTRRYYRLKSRLKNEIESIQKSQEKNGLNVTNQTDKNHNSQLINFEKIEPPKILSEEKHEPFGSNQLGQLSSDHYSSEDSSQQEEQSLLSEISRLRKDRKNQVSKRIWKSIDFGIRKAIQSYLPVPSFKQLISEPQEEERSLNGILKPKNIEINNLALDPSADQRSEARDRKSENNIEMAKVIFSKLQTIKIEKDFQYNESQQYEKL